MHEHRWGLVFGLKAVEDSTVGQPQRRLIGTAPKSHLAVGDSSQNLGGLSSKAEQVLAIETKGFSGRAFVTTPTLLNSAGPGAERKRLSWAYGKGNGHMEIICALWN